LSARKYGTTHARVFEDEKYGVLAVGGTVELGLNVDAWGGGEGEAVANVSATFGWRG
jgi:hypothetical protein